MNTKLQCEVDFCDRQASCRAKNARVLVCKGHYQQDWLGRPFSPFRTYERIQTTPDGLRRCNRCKTFRPESDYYRRVDGSIREKCRFCCIEISAANQNKGAEQC